MPTKRLKASRSRGRRRKKKDFKLRISPIEPTAPSSRPPFVTENDALPPAQRLIATIVSRGLERFAIADIIRTIAPTEAPSAALLRQLSATPSSWPLHERTANETAFNVLEAALSASDDGEDDGVARRVKRIARRRVVDADPSKAIDPTVCSDELLPAWEWGQRRVLTLSRMTNSAVAGVGSTVLLFVRPSTCPPERVLELRTVEHAVAVVAVSEHLAADQPPSTRLQTPESNAATTEPSAATPSSVTALLPTLVASAAAVTVVLGVAPPPGTMSRTDGTVAAPATPHGARRRRRSLLGVAPSLRGAEETPAAASAPPAVTPKSNAARGNALCKLPPLSVLRDALEAIPMTAWANAWRVWQRVCVGSVDASRCVQNARCVGGEREDAAAIAALPPMPFRVSCCRGGAYDASTGTSAWTSSDAARCCANSFLGRDGMDERGWGGMVSLERFRAEALLFVGNCGTICVGMRISPPHGLHRRFRARYDAKTSTPALTPKEEKQKKKMKEKKRQEEGEEEYARHGASSADGTANVALKSTIAYAMLHISEPCWRDDGCGVGNALIGASAHGCSEVEAGAGMSTLIDPCCGNGIIPLVASSLYPRLIERGALRVVGSDLDAASVAVAVAAQNVACGKSSRRPCEFMLSDCRNLPLKTASVDRVVTDMPFGHRCSSGSQVGKLMPALLREVVRVLRPGGGASCAW